MSYAEKMIGAIQEGNLDQADLYLDQALDEDDQDILEALALTLYEMGFLDQSEKVSRHLHAVNPQSDASKLLLAEVALEKGQETEALDLLLSIDSDSDYYVESLMVQADYYQMNHLYEVSEQKLLEAKDLTANHPVLIFALGELYLSVQRYFDAAREYQQLIDKGYEIFEGSNIQARLGQALSGYGEFEEAIDHFQRALDLEDNVDTYYQMGLTYYQMEDYPKAKRSLYELIDQDPSYVTAYPVLIQINRLLEDDEANRSLIDQALKQDQTNPDLYLEAARFYLKENPKQAEQYYDQALALNPTSETILLEVVNFHLEESAYEKVIERLDLAQEMDLIDPQLKWAEAIAQNELENYDEARQAFDEAYLAFGDDATFLKDYIFFLREDGQREKMIARLEDYVRLVPDDLEMQEMLAEERQN